MKMHRLYKYLFPTLGLSLVVAACGSSSSSTSSAAKTPAAQSSVALVKTAPNPKLGTTLVNAQGMTLYQLSVERNGKFICTTPACLQNWHPLTVPSGATPSGAVSLGTVKRPDGTEQVTYKGLPLYAFAADHAPGQANGQGFKDVGTWHAATTSAASTGSSSSGGATSSSATTPASGGGGYGY
jgi:predicted lipoprotein with Yx(FWY)xxD motif